MTEPAATPTATLDAARRAHAAGKLDRAWMLYQALLAADPLDAEALHLSGALALQRRDHSVARARIIDSLRLVPDRGLFYANLATVEWETGRVDAAEVAIARARRIEPRLLYCDIMQARIARHRGRAAEAIALYRGLLDRDPRRADIRFELGDLLLQQGDGGALLELERVLDENPAHSGAIDRLAYAYRLAGYYTRSRAMLVRMLGLFPTSDRTLTNLALVQRDSGLIEDALLTYARAAAIAPDNPTVFSDLLFTQHYSPRFHLAALRESAEAWGRRFPAAAPPVIPPRGRDPDRRLRVGFVSPDLRRHPVGYFARRLFAHHDRDRMAFVCYANSSEADDLTAALRAEVAAWHNVATLDDTALADRIRADEIDILVDLAGHTGRNRLLMLQQRPAPLAMTWAGWCGTTGAAIDYLIADRWQVPEELEWGYTERILRLPDGYVVYDPPDAAPPVVALPARRAGAVTFGSFNNLSKISEPVVALWASILRELPQSRLVLKTRALLEAQVAERIAWMFGLQGIGSGQLRLEAGGSQADMLAAYAGIDIALDSFPYSGGLTTCEALWMGVPVLTLPGQTFAGRHSLSHLGNVGLTDWVARDVADYRAKAIGFARDIAPLATLRTTLRDRVAASPLTDGRRFATNFQAALRQAWIRRLEQD